MIIQIIGSDYFLIYGKRICFCSQEKGSCRGEPTNEDAFKLRRDKRQGNNCMMPLCVLICRASLHFDILTFNQKTSTFEHFLKSIAFILSGLTDKPCTAFPSQETKQLLTVFILIGFDGLLDPVDKLGDSSVDARSHGVGASQTPWCHTLQDEPVLGITHQRTAAVALQGQGKKILKSHNQNVLIMRILFDKTLLGEN